MDKTIFQIFIIQTISPNFMLPFQHSDFLAQAIRRVIAKQKLTHFSATRRKTVTQLIKTNKTFSHVYCSKISRRQQVDDVTHWMMQTLVRISQVLSNRFTDESWLPYGQCFVVYCLACRWVSRSFNRRHALKFWRFHKSMRSSCAAEGNKFRKETRTQGWCGCWAQAWTWMLEESFEV